LLSSAAAAVVSLVEEAPERRSRYTVRWLRRLLEEDANLSIEEAALAASALVALGGRSHGEALSTLSALAERATRQRSEAS
jgi:hypothetical protein